MINIKQRPDGLLLITAIALSWALVLPPIVHFDLKDKTMFSAPLATIAWIIPLLLLSFWLLYLLTRRFLYSLTIARIHVLVTVSTTILIVIVLFVGINSLESASHGDHDGFLTDRQELIGYAIRILSIIFVCAQSIYLANVLLGLFAKNK